MLARPWSCCRLRFVLGTESGMITAIVRRVESMLRDSGRKDVEVEIIFPVSADAVSTESQTTSSGAPLVLPNGLTIVPGAASGASTSTSASFGHHLPHHRYPSTADKCAVTSLEGHK